MGSGHVWSAGVPGGEPDRSISGATFRGTLTILMLLPDAPVAQPYALIVGSVCGAAVGTGISFFGSGLGTAVLAMIAAFVVISLIHAYHPPGVALASIPVLLHPGSLVSSACRASFHRRRRGICGGNEYMAPRLARISQVAAELLLIIDRWALILCPICVSPARHEAWWDNARAQCAARQCYGECAESRLCPPADRTCRAFDR
jgi:hypothetical protein